jgi:uncharacterized membrane protein YkvA (DUF1232 family)
MDLQSIVLVIAGAVAGFLLLLATAAAFLWWRIQRSGEKQLAKRIARLEFRDKLALGGSVIVDRRIPPITRIVAVALVLYLAMPFDLIPDFIPIIGFLDDFLIVMLGTAIILRTIPRSVIEEHVSRYEYIEGEAHPVMKGLPEAGPRR